MNTVTKRRTIPEKLEKLNPESLSQCDQNTSGLLTAWSPDGPTLRFPELLKVTRVGRSKAFELMNAKHRNYDPDFPVGFPLFDTPRSPKVWWTSQAIAWLESREKKSLSH